MEAGKSVAEIERADIAVVCAGAGNRRTQTKKRRTGMLRAFVAILVANGARREWQFRAIAAGVTAFCAAVAKTDTLVRIA